MNQAGSVEERLTDCFAAVFSDIPRTELPRATADTVPGWDSIALVTLIAAVEEEFAVTLEPDVYPGLTSFQAFVPHLGAAK